MTTQEEDRRIKIGGKTHTLQPFKLKQLKKIAGMAKLMGGEDTAAEAGFEVLAMALSNAVPPIEGDLDELPFEAEELQDAMAKVQRLAGFKPKESAPEGEATAPAPGA